MAKMLMENPNTEEVRNRHIAADDLCARKARNRKQVTFTIVEQDKTAPETIAEWIKLNIRTAPPAKLYDALEAALVMRESKVEKKDAD